MRKHQLCVTIKEETWLRLQDYRAKVGLAELTERALHKLLNDLDSDQKNLDMLLKDSGTVPLVVRTSKLEQRVQSLEESVTSLTLELERLQERIHRLEPDY